MISSTPFRILLNTRFPEHLIKPNLNFYVKTTHSQNL